ncbi:SDR family NAD(P)-dependent oxidoreductase [Planococcus lenghuensis]|uniref:Short-chain dehydrogenase n=1 Tax=Planococcus lenghuensis TaxID=2213202 RepID=A0A1Q2KVW5_9BACL|nr:SDR family oxidoreductase [Planococcus lenghuensis]AQQ52340.1 short-chain dehydrogenase [Planococcus lenghuensis]
MSVFSNEALQGKHVLVTGATGGIGFETAKMLVQMGANVTITGRNPEKLRELETQLLELAGRERIFSRTADLTKEEDRHALIAEAENALGFINALVNSAGVSGGDTVENLEEAFIEQLMNLNFKSTFMLTQPIYKKMMERGEGSIVNVSSLSGLRGTYGNSAYAASKFALTGWTQSMAVEAIEYGIRVNAVCPGYVDTEMARSSIRRRAGRHGVSFEDAFKQAENTIPSGRLTEAVEVANTIAFLLTDAARNIVGESVKISGGSVMR